MQLSKFFTLDELTFSNTAKAERIDNTPTAAETESLKALCGSVLDPLREAVGRPIKVTSGYRGPALNRRIGGAKKSQHLVGQAADIQCPGMPVLQLFQTIIRMKLPYDQIIYEVKGTSEWVHVSHDAAGNQGEVLLAKFAGGSVTYPRITAEQALAMTAPVTRSAGPQEEPGYEEAHDEPERRAKAPAKKAAAKKAAAKKTAAKKAPAKKAAAKKAPAKKVAAKKAPAKKAAAKKAPAKKAASKKAPARKAAAKKAPAKKVARKSAKKTAKKSAR